MIRRAHRIHPKSGQTAGRSLVRSALRTLARLGEAAEARAALVWSREEAKALGAAALLRLGVMVQAQGAALLRLGLMVEAQGAAAAFLRLGVMMEAQGAAAALLRLGVVQAQRAALDHARTPTWPVYSNCVSLCVSTCTSSHKDNHQFCILCYIESF